MSILNTLAAALAWLGRQGTRALAISVFLGLAVPQLADYVKPYLGETVFVLLLFSYLRTDPGAVRRLARSPGRVIAGTLWVMVGVPVLFGTAYALSGLREAIPPLYTIMILHIAIAPITSSVAFAALMGIDTGLSLTTLILSNAISPLTTVAFSYVFLGASVFSPLKLGSQIFLFYAASGALAYVIRRIAGQAWIDAKREHIDGLNVIAIFVFAIVAMESVPRNVLADPLFAAVLMAAIVAIAALLVALSLLVFWRAGIEHGLVIGMLAAFRNVGLVMATLGPSLPDVCWFYFALAQFPIFLFPQLLKPLARRFPASQAERK